MYGVACHPSPFTISLGGSISLRHHPPVISSSLLVTHSGAHQCRFFNLIYFGVLVAAHGLFLAAASWGFAPVAEHQFEEGKEAQ